jgi:nucleotide-binding universal stress UspA family protein
VLTDAEHTQLRTDTTDSKLQGRDVPPSSPLAREQHAWDILRHRARSYLAAQAQQLQAAGYGVTYSIDAGEPAMCITEAATQTPATMIALATHGYGGLRRWALGSVTDEVVHATRLPVLIVRSADQPQATPLALRRIMVPLDGSECARQALPLACELARRAQAELLLLRAAAAPVAVAVDRDSLYALPVADQTRPPDGGFTHSDQTLGDLEMLATTLRQEGVAAKPLLTAGDAAAAIVEEAGAHRVDLIVLATHDHGPARRWRARDIVDTLLHTTPAPLLRVRVRAAA